MVGFIRCCIFSPAVPFILTISITKMCAYELKLWSQNRKPDRCFVPLFKLLPNFYLATLEIDMDMDIYGYPWIST